MCVIRVLNVAVFRRPRYKIRLLKIQQFIFVLPDNVQTTHAALQHDFENAAFNFKVTVLGSATLGYISGITPKLN